MSGPSLWDESSSEDELPAEYQKVVIDNEIWYRNCLTGLQHQAHPITGNVKRVSSKLPHGWIKSTDGAGHRVFINSELKCASYIDPRLGSGKKVHTKSDSQYLRLKYDKFSSAEDILLGKDLRGRHLIITGSGCGLGLWIAKTLVCHGAIVVCACPRCPPDATFPNDNSQLTNDGTRLFWIPYDPTCLKTVIQFVETYKSLGWPLHACILAADVLGPTTPSNFMHQILNRTIYHSKLSRSWTHSRLYHAFQNLISFVKQKSSNLVQYFLRDWIPPLSCECTLPSIGHSLSSDGLEVSIQVNYLAQVLLVRCLLPILKQTADQLGSTDDVCLRIVILTGSGYRCSKLKTSHHLNASQLFDSKPSTLISRLEQYINAKYCLLLFGHELRNRLNQWQHDKPHLSKPIDIYACHGSNLMSTYCMGSLWRRCRQPWKDTFLLLLHLTSFAVKLFGKSVNQVASNPMLCAIEDSATFDKALTVSGKRIQRTLMVTNCRPDHLVTNQLDLAQMDSTARHLWELTDQMLEGITGLGFKSKF